LNISHIGVFCGFGSGTEAAFTESARVMGAALAGRGIGLVYGGGSTGLQGALARGALENGGQVVGVMPRMLVERGLALKELETLHVAEDLAAHKRKMAELGDGFIALPGGLGTLEELFEMLTWAQLGIHRKPCGVLNADGYFDKLFGFLDHAARKGFMSDQDRRFLLSAESPDGLLDLFDQYEPARSRRLDWIEKQ